MKAADSDRCPTCRAAVPVGATQCPACGRLLQEADRCPHCRAIAPVVERRGRTVCAACGRPREGTSIGDDRPIGLAPATINRAGAGLFRTFGAFSIGGAILGAAAAAWLFSGFAGFAAAALTAAVGIGVGAWALKAGSKQMERARKATREEAEGQVLALAREREGRVTAPEVAEALGIGLAEADALLTQMVGDGTNVDVEVDDEGNLHFVIRALRPRTPKVRVEDPGPEVEELEVEATQEAEDRARRSSS